MKTTSLGIENLCVPCNSSCRYCLLSSCGKATGVAYDRGKRLAKRLYDEVNEADLGCKVYHYIGYCMDAEHLVDYIRFSQQIGSPSARFLQLNGLKMRDELQTKELVRNIRAEGIKQIDLTFYGTEAYHDRFAGRQSDFAFLLRILSAAEQVGLDVHISCPIHKENMAQMDELLSLLDGYATSGISLFLPHGKGRGRYLEDLRLAEDDLDRLSSRTRTLLRNCRAEREWISDGFCDEPKSRTLVLSLKPDNIEMLEKMSVQQILRYLEEMDDRYYAQVPSINELAMRYGKRDGNRLYRRDRDLYLEWQQRFLDETNADIWDMNDETHHFSIRT